jgi:hypothetical protein
MGGPHGFGLWNNLTDIIASSLGFVLSLALNTAFKETFDLIPLGMKTKVVNDWIYVFVVGTVVLLLLWAIYAAKQARKPREPPLRADVEGHKHPAVVM